jgi:hypothetical protein
MLRPAALSDVLCRGVEVAAGVQDVQGTHAGGAVRRFTVETALWVALGLLVAVVTLEVWGIRSDLRRRREAMRRLRERELVRPARMTAAVQLVREPEPLEEPRVLLGRIGPAGRSAK